MQFNQADDSSNILANGCEKLPIHLPRYNDPPSTRPIEESRRILEERQVLASVRAGPLSCSSLSPSASFPHPQAKAQQQRDKIQEEKTQKSKIVTEKVGFRTPLLPSYLCSKALPCLPRFVKLERHVTLVQSSGERRWRGGCRGQ